MEKVEKDITVSKLQHVITYVAFDGNEFDTENECKEYEKSATFAYSKLLVGCVQRKTYNRAITLLDDLMDGGRQTSYYYTAILNTKEDKKNLLGWLHSLGYKEDLVTNNYYKDKQDLFYLTATEDLKTKVPYIIQCNPESNYYAIIALSKFLEKFVLIFNEVVGEKPNTSDNESKEN